MTASHDADLFALVTACLTRDKPAAADIIHTMTHRELQGTLIAALGELVATIENGIEEDGLSSTEFLDHWRRMLVEDGRL